MLPFVFLASIAAFGLGYRFYGSFVSRRLGLDDPQQTPAETRHTGVDYVPPHAPVLQALAGTQAFFPFSLTQPLGWYATPT